MVLAGTGLLPAPVQAVPTAGPGDVAAASLPSPALDWSHLVTVDTGAPYLGEYPVQAMSCPEATFCVAVTQDGSILTATDPAGGVSAWTTHGRLPLAAGDSGNYAGSLSCPTSSLCVAAQESGEPALYTIVSPAGGTGSTVTRETTGSVGSFTSLQCPAADRCFALDTARGILTSSDPAGGLSSWTAVAVADDLFTLSCPSTGLCLASTYDGELHASRTPAIADSWALADAPEWDALMVSCVSDSLCVATGRSRSDEVESLQVATTTEPDAGEGSGTWTTTSLTGTPAEVPDGLSCFRSGMCVITMFDHLLVSANPAGGASAWVTGAETFPGLLTPGVECPSTTLCLSLRRTGGLLVSVTPTGGASTWIETIGLRPFNAFADVSCVKGLCVAVDVTGHVATATDPENGPWRTATIAADHELTAVDCVSAKLCVAVDSSGNAFVSTRPATGSWTRVRVTKNADLRGVSCPSTRLCVAVDRDGRVYSTKKPKGTWTKRTTRKFAPVSLDCPTTRLCVAADGEGRVVTSRAPLTKAWSLARLAKMQDGGGADVSCPTSSFCAVAFTSFDEGELEGRVYLATRPASGAKAWKSTRPSLAVTSVACAGSTWCYGIAYDRRTERSGLVGTSAPRKASSWSVVEEAAEAHGMSQVSCAGRSRCVAVGMDQIVVGS